MYHIGYIEYAAFILELENIDCHCNKDKNSRIFW